MKNNLYLILIILITALFLFQETTIAKEESTVNIQSEAAILMDAKTGTVLYEKNAYEKMYPASITKIATAIYAIEKGNLDDAVTISENARNVDGTRVYLEPGEEVPLKQLIIGLLMNSGNDAGVAIAEHLHGSVENFAEELNEFLQEQVGVKNTQFKNPHGLFDSGHYTTAYDMSLITQYALKNETFQQFFKMAEYEWHSKAWNTTIYTHHRILKGEFPYEGVTGGKNGFVDESGFTLVTTAKRDHIELIAVTLKAPYSEIPYTDTLALLDFGFNEFETSFIQKDTEFQSNEEKFKVSSNLYYTQPKDEKIQTEVSEKGILTVKTEDGEVIETFQLKDSSKAKEAFSSKTLDDKGTSSSSEEKSYWPMILLVLSGIGGCIFLYNRLKPA